MDKEREKKYADYLFPPFSEGNLPRIMPFLAQTYRTINNQVTKQNAKWILNMRAFLSGNLDDIDLGKCGEASSGGFISVKALLMFPDDAQKQVVPFLRNIAAIVQIR